MLYSLQSYLTVRKEWFGVLVSNPRTGEFHQFNHDTLKVLQVLQSPHSVNSLLESLDQSDMSIGHEYLSELLTDLLSTDIITTDVESTGNEILYLDDFVPENYLIVPSSVTIYITQYCGKACRHCVTESHPKIQQSNELNIEQWIKIINQLKGIGVMGLVFTGGEPLSKDGIFEILTYADSLNFRIAILTDLDGMNAEIIQKLKKLKNLADLQTSLDGASAESHDFIRGKGSFIKTMARLQELSLSGIPYTISCSVNTINYNELDAIAQIAQQYKAGYLYLNPVAPYGRAKKAMRKYILNEEQLFILAHKYLSMIKNGQIHPGNAFWEENLDRLDDPLFHPFREALGALSLGVYNFSVGQLGECYLDSKMKAEKILYLGNAVNDDLSEMWDSNKLTFLRKASSRGRSFIDITEIGIQFKRPNIRMLFS